MYDAVDASQVLTVAIALGAAGGGWVIRPMLDVIGSCAVAHAGASSAAVSSVC